MNNLLSVLHILLPVLLASLILIKKDRYEGDHPFWIKQNWSCLDVLLILGVIALLQLCSLILVKFNILSSYLTIIYGRFLFTVLVGLIQYKILLSKYTFNFSSIGLKCNGLLPNIVKGLKIFILYTLIVGFISILLNHEELIFDRAKSLIKLHLFQLPLEAIVLTILGLVVVAPFIEEFIYRGLMYSPFQRKFGVNGSICATSFFWSLNHLQMQSFFAIFLIGILLCYLYRKTQSLVPGMFVHSLINLSDLIIYIIAGNLHHC